MQAVDFIFRLNVATVPRLLPSWRMHVKFSEAPSIQRRLLKPSGVTATMIKSWPSETHELVFTCIWQHRTTPHWSLHSYLHPIPKKGPDTLDNLRPLGLYEITRKILAAIIIKRAYRAWKSKQLLNSNQHAFFIS